VVTELVLAEWEEGICTLTLNHPRKKNALSLALLEELGQAVETLADNEELRAVILQGAEGAFSVGADLADVTGTAADQEIDRRIEQVTQRMQALPVPCLAAIEGPCVGGAVTLTLACEALVASERAFFQIPATRLGLLYQPDAVARLHARMGSRTLMRLLLLGERWDAQTALQAGLVGWVVPEGTAHEKALGLAQKVAKAPQAVGATKSLLLALERGERDLSSWQATYAEILNSPERKAAVAKAKERLGIA